VIAIAMTTAKKAAAVAAAVSKDMRRPPEL
jgi:hypothetical protein